MKSDGRQCVIAKDGGVIFKSDAEKQGSDWVRKDPKAAESRPAPESTAEKPTARVESGLAQGKKS